MNHRSQSPNDKNKTNYNHEKNKKFSKKKNSSKNDYSRNREVNYKKSPKSYDSNYDKNHEHRRRAGNEYSNSRNFSGRSSHNNQRDYSNDKNKSKYHDVNYNNEYGGREDSYNKYSNLERQEGEEGDNYSAEDDKRYPETYYRNSKKFHSDSDENNELSDYNEAKPQASLRDRKKKIQIVTRSMWDSEPPDPRADKLPQKPFNHINYVDTSSPMCHNQEECFEVLKFIKERDHFIKYNFYIGGDNVIYEGKGWVADVNEETGYNKRAVDVAFIGTFTVNNLPKAPMLDQACDFVYYCITSKMIYQNFTCSMFKEYLDPR